MNTTPQHKDWILTIEAQLQRPDSFWGKLATEGQHFRPLEIANEQAVIPEVTASYTYNIKNGIWMILLAVVGLALVFRYILPESIGFACFLGAIFLLLLYGGIEFIRDRSPQLEIGETGITLNRHKQFLLWEEILTIHFKVEEGRTKRTLLVIHFIPPHQKGYEKIEYNITELNYPVQHVAQAIVKKNPRLLN